MWKEIRNVNLGCHGIPERCLVHQGKRMSICARCYGSNIGHIIAIILFVSGFMPGWLLSTLMLAVLLLDWGIQEFLGIMSNNKRRVVTGIIGGVGMGCLIWNGVLVLVDWLKT